MKSVTGILASVLILLSVLCCSPTKNTQSPAATSPSKSPASSDGKSASSNISGTGFTITGRLLNGDGSPMAKARLTLDEVTKRGDVISLTYTYKQGIPVTSSGETDPIGESNGDGAFVIQVMPSVAKKGQDYAIEFEYISEPTRTRGFLGNGDSVLLFRIEGNPREINVGEITVENEFEEAKRLAETPKSKRSNIRIEKHFKYPDH